MNDATDTESLPTVDDVLRAYADTGLKPGTRFLYAREDDGEYACAHGALVAQRLGMDALRHWGNILYGSSTQPFIASLSYISGLEDGFDGRIPTQSRSENDPDYAMGFDVGRQAAEELFNGA